MVILNMKKLAYVSTCAALMLLAGCTSPTKQVVEPTLEAVEKNDFSKANKAAAAALLANLAPKQLSTAYPLLSATVVDVNVLEKSSTLGRVLAEQISGSFTQNGFQMVELKFRDNIYMKRNEGELMLTREITDVAQQHRAQAVIVGTYGVASNMVLVNLKVVQVGTNQVLAVHDYVLPLDRNVRALLKN